MEKRVEMTEQEIVHRESRLWHVHKWRFSSILVLIRGHRILNKWEPGFATLNYVIFQFKYLSSKCLLMFVMLSIHADNWTFMALKVLSKCVSSAVDFEIVLPRGFSQLRLQAGASASLSWISSFSSPFTQNLAIELFFLSQIALFLIKVKALF